MRRADRAIADDDHRASAADRLRKSRPARQAGLHRRENDSPTLQRAIDPPRRRTRRGARPLTDAPAQPLTYLRVEKWDWRQAASVKMRRKRLRLGACPIFSTYC